MMWKIIGLVLLICCFGIFAVDWVFFLKDRYCRFHIGRWETHSWEAAVKKTALRWLKHTPTVKITDNSRYMLFDFIQGKYRSQSIQSWQKAALILGLLESDDAASKTAAKKVALELLNEKGNWKVPPVAVDCGMLSFAILKAVDNPNLIRPAMDFTRNLIEGNINKDGMISYTGGAENPEMYVDTLGLTCPFLALYAKVYGVPACEEVAYHQLMMYHKYGLLDGTALPNHAFHIKTKLPLGVYGWGRGTAWYVIGLLDTYYDMETAQYKEDVRRWIVEAAESYYHYQREDGGFGSILQRNNTYDSSATAVLAWFYERCYVLLEQKKYQEVADTCLLKLMKKTRITGAIDWCQGDTKGIGIFAQTYDVMPFAQGMAIRAIYTRKNKG